jgi:hypothetical protein
MKRTSSDNSLNRKPAARQIQNAARPSPVRNNSNTTRQNAAQPPNIDDIHNIIAFNTQNMNALSSSYQLMRIDPSFAHFPTQPPAQAVAQAFATAQAEPPAQALVTAQAKPPAQGNTRGKDINAMLERLIANSILELSQPTTQPQPQAQTQPQPQAQTQPQPQPQAQTPLERINFNVVELKNYIDDTLPIPQNNQDEINSDALFLQASGDRNTIVITLSSHFRDLDGIRTFQTSINNISNTTNDIYDRTSSEYILLNFLQDNQNATFYNAVTAENYRRLNLRDSSDLKHLLKYVKKKISRP